MPFLTAVSLIDMLGNILIRVSLQEKDEIIEKTITIDQFLMVLSESREGISNLSRIGQMPTGYYDGNFDVSDGGNFSVVLRYPGKKRQFIYEGNHFFIPFPPLVFYFKYNFGRRELGYVWAVCNEEINNKTVFMQYPFGNVYTDGSICFGNIKGRKLRNMREIDLVVEDFFLGITSNDSYRKQNTRGLSQGELIQLIKDKKEFPTDLLCPTYVTLEDILCKL